MGAKAGRGTRGGQEVRVGWLIDWVFLEKGRRSCCVGGEGGGGSCSVVRGRGGGEAGVGGWLEQVRSFEVGCVGVSMLCGEREGG